MLHHGKSTSFERVSTYAPYINLVRIVRTVIKQSKTVFLHWLTAIFLFSFLGGYSYQRQKFHEDFLEIDYENFFLKEKTREEVQCKHTHLMMS